MKTFFRPDFSAKQYGALASVAAIEPPVLMALEAGDNNVLDGQVGDELIVYPSGNHPSASMQIAKRCGELAKTTVDFTEGPIPYHKLKMDKYRCHSWHAMGRPNNKYGATFLSLSCPFKCSFCQIHAQYGKYRKRNYMWAVQDVLTLNNMGITNIKMLDELFAVNNSNVWSFCEAIAYHGLDLNIWGYARIDTVTPALLAMLRKAGVRWLAYGIESGDEAIRESVNKGGFSNERICDVVQMTKDAGINVLANFMMGFKDDTIETMGKTRDLLFKLMPQHANIYCLVDYNSDETNQYSPLFVPSDTNHVSGGIVRDFRDKTFSEYFLSNEYLQVILTEFGPSARDEVVRIASTTIRSKT
jgi:radical SAM superfamily enzyme YgiQ (UPF0313 family)